MDADTKIALWLVESKKIINNPLGLGLTISHQISDWWVETQIPVSSLDAFIKISFIIDSCERYVGFGRVNIDVVFNGKKSHCYRSLVRIQEKVDKELENLEAFLEQIPRD